MKLACADREGFFGDPDQVDVPIRGLLDKGYADERRKLIRDDRAWPELPLPGDSEANKHIDPVPIPGKFFGDSRS